MAYYFQQDIQVDDNGDIFIDDRGDLPLAEPKDSVNHALKFMLATDLNEMPSEPQLGANFGSLIGDTDPTEISRQIPVMVREGIREQGILAQEDVTVRAVQIDIDKIYITVTVNGQFLLEDGTLDPNPETRLRFIFPYVDGELEILD